ncbi:MAG: Clp protease N-terminal domain-containing protein, partial [Chloroflexota bacterium]
MEPRLSPEFIKQLSPSSKRAIRVAFAVSNQLQQSAVDTEHLLIGLNEKQEGVTNNLLTAFGYGEPDQLLPSLATFAGWQVDKEPSIVQAKMNDGELSSLAYSADVLAIFDQAAEIAKRKGHGVIRARHLLTGLLAMDSAAATRWLKEIEVPVAETRDYLIDLPEDTIPSAESFRALRPAPVEDPVVALTLAQAGERTLLVTARQHSGVTVSDTASGDPVGQPVKGVAPSSQVTS